MTVDRKMAAVNWSVKPGGRRSYRECQTFADRKSRRFTTNWRQVMRVKGSRLSDSNDCHSPVPPQLVARLPAFGDFFEPPTPGVKLG
jgi:hypothetical protein